MKATVENTFLGESKSEKKEHFEIFQKQEL
jgi:hypothetical protein